MISRIRLRRNCTVRPLLRDEGGAVAMEFGIIAIAFFTMLLGMMDVGQMMYTQSIANGAAQAAARASSLETGDAAAADAALKESILRVAPNANITTERVSYFDFNDVDRAEKWDDKDSSGICDNDENYVDENGNGKWDADIGVKGNGGAGDVVIYTISISYRPLFPIPFYDSRDPDRSMSTTFVRKNQPFSKQQEYGSSVGVCS